MLKIPESQHLSQSLRPETQYSTQRYVVYSEFSRTYSAVRSDVQNRTDSVPEHGPPETDSTRCTSRFDFSSFDNALASNGTGVPARYTSTPLIVSWPQGIAARRRERGFDRRRWMRDGPALRGIERKGRAAFRARLAHHELPMGVQVAWRHGTSQPMQRMIGMRDQHEAQPQQVLAEELERLSDPRLGFVTITGVAVSADLRHADVFYTVMGPPAQHAETAAGLTAAKPHLRATLGRQVRMKYLPDLHFREDPGLEQGLRIEAILRDAVIVEAASGDQAAPGTIVELRFVGSDDTMTYLLGSIEGQLQLATGAVLLVGFSIASLGTLWVTRQNLLRDLDADTSSINRSISGEVKDSLASPPLERNRRLLQARVKHWFIIKPAFKLSFFICGLSLG